MKGIAKWLQTRDAPHRLALSSAIAAAVWLALWARCEVSTQSIAAWDAFAFSLQALAWFAIVSTPQDRLRTIARKQDSSRTVMFVFAIGSACASLFAVVFLFKTKDVAQAHLPTHIFLTVLAVVLSWSLTHTLFGLRYAHKFYGEDTERGGERPRGGLDFPGEKAPAYADFVYFSFVIGMTFQVSDVQITSGDFRRLVLIHSLLSFAFNTVILALTINTVSSLI